MADISKPTSKLPVVELYLVDADNPRLFIDGAGDRTSNRRHAIPMELDAPEALIPPKGMAWRYVRLKKPTRFN